ncbi:hypothetical protein RvY_02119 [Ramazzottius varieornatus]|uniref:Uncharacterized protein n=1 Tax=Ramazzottius varieornatus TaxID=947166 RepID=A0A1D1UIL8_RAMVA|nr:hypothetical protein RvY_02119 [Ramazzottius varieornatus]
MPMKEKRFLLAERMAKGFRKPSMLRFWDKFDRVLAFLLDIMHQLDEGVVRWIITQIITVDGNSGITKAQLNAIERLWMSVALPGHQNRSVRSLDDYKSWKAHELKFFIQHAAPFVLKGNCSEGFYFLVCLLSRIGWLATHDEIDHESLKEIESRCTRYVKTFQDYFGIEQMKYFIHLMLHLPLAIELFGPLHLSSCYRPENQIGRVTRKICNHTKNIMDSFLKLQECTARMEDMLTFANSKVMTTAKRLMRVPASPHVIKGVAGTCRLIGQSNVIEDGEAYAEVRREGRRRKECWSRDRVYCFRKAAAEVGIVVRTKKHSQSQQKSEFIVTDVNERVMYIDMIIAVMDCEKKNILHTFVYAKLFRKPDEDEMEDRIAGLFRAEYPHIFYTRPSENILLPTSDLRKHVAFLAWSDDDSGIIVSPPSNIYMTT